MVEKHRTRVRHTSMVYSQKNREYIDEIHIPIESIGICEGKIGSNTQCRIYGELGDGLCITCWDKSHKRILTMKQERRKAKISKESNIKELLTIVEILNAR
tara:strand:- start:157 stop:459 length:303 start_codon:yes stop_codon:yes gene_type:complete